MPGQQSPPDDRATGGTLAPAPRTRTRTPASASMASARTPASASMAGATAQLFEVQRRASSGEWQRRLAFLDGGTLYIRHSMRQHQPETIVIADSTPIEEQMVDHRRAIVIQHSELCVISADTEREQAALVQALARLHAPLRNSLLEARSKAKQAGLPTSHSLDATPLAPIPEGTIAVGSPATETPQSVAARIVAAAQRVLGLLDAAPDTPAAADGVRTVIQDTLQNFDRLHALSQTQPALSAIEGDIAVDVLAILMGMSHKDQLNALFRDANALHLQTEALHRMHRRIADALEGTHGAPVSRTDGTANVAVGTAPAPCGEAAAPNSQPAQKRNRIRPMRLAGHELAVPPLPSIYYERTAEIEAVQRMLANDIASPSSATGTAVGITGMSGIGKSVLAQAIAGRLVDPANEAADGDRFEAALWVSAGPDGKIPALLAKVVHAITGREPVFDTVQNAMAAFKQCTASRALLIVLDNACDGALLDAFSAAGPRCRLLVTAQQDDVVSRCLILHLGPLADEHAVRLLLMCAEYRPEEQPDHIMRRIACDICARHPLAIQLMGARVTQYVVAERQAVLEDIINNERRPNSTVMEKVLHGIDRSLDVVYKSTPSCEDLGLLPKSTYIPADALDLIWKLAEIFNLQWKALIAVADATPGGRTLAYRVHELVADRAAVALCITETRRIRQLALLSRLKARCAKGEPVAWWTVAPCASGTAAFKGFALQMIWQLLRETGQNAELVRLCCAFDWMYARAQHGSLSHPLDDYADALRVNEDAMTASMLREAVETYRKSLPILSIDRSLLPAQIVARANPDVLNANPMWAAFVERARAVRAQPEQPVPDRPG